MIAKAPVERFVHGFDFDLHRGGFFAGICRNSCGAILNRDRFIFFDPNDIGIAGDELDIVCDLADGLAVASFFEDELLARFGAVKGDRGREDG